MGSLAFLEKFSFNLIIFLFLGVAIISCFIRYKKGQHGYRHYTIFFIGLTISRIIQLLFLRLFPSRSFLGITISLIITIILITSLLNFYFGFKEEKKAKSSRKQ